MGKLHPLGPCDPNKPSVDAPRASANADLVESLTCKPHPCLTRLKAWPSSLSISPRDRLKFILGSQRGASGIWKWTPSYSKGSGSKLMALKSKIGGGGIFSLLSLDSMVVFNEKNQLQTISRVLFACSFRALGRFVFFVVVGVHVNRVVRLALQDWALEG